MIYIDSPRLYPNAPARLRNRPWSHLWSSTNDAVEVLVFGHDIGLRLSWFQDRPGFPHFDVMPVYRRKAIEAGAQEKSLREWLAELSAAEVRA